MSHLEILILLFLSEILAILDYTFFILDFIHS